jgi:uncharacterized protein (TIGR02611 family)
MERFKQRWRRTPRNIRVPLVFLVGWLVVFAGIIMLVTPGPGWATIFLGFAILATEFASAIKVRDKMVTVFKALARWFKRFRKRIKKQ